MAWLVCILARLLVSYPFCRFSSQGERELHAITFNVLFVRTLSERTWASVPPPPPPVFVSLNYAAEVTWQATAPALRYLQLHGSSDSGEIRSDPTTRSWTSWTASTRTQGSVPRRRRCKCLFDSWRFISKLSVTIIRGYFSGRWIWELSAAVAFVLAFEGRRKTLTTRVVGCSQGSRKG